MDVADLFFSFLGSVVLRAVNALFGTKFVLRDGSKVVLGFTSAVLIIVICFNLVWFFSKL